MRLYGEIGTKVDGDYFAQEIGYLAENSDVVNIRINSPGGSILQGLSIVSAILTAKAQVVTYIDGVAASMAGIVAVAGHRVIMNDFAKLMIHDPYFIDDNGEKVEKLDARNRRAIGAMKSILTSILKRRCGENADIEAMMKAETWLGADDAKAAGLVDEIAGTGRDLKNMEPLRLVALLSDEVEQNTGNMKQLTARLNLAETADEQAIITAVDQLETDARAKEKVLVDTLIGIARTAGKANEADEASLRTLAGTDLNAFVSKVGITTADIDRMSNVRLSEVIAKMNESKKTETPEHDWAWYQANDIEALRAMRRDNPDKFKAMYKAYWGADYE